VEPTAREFLRRLKEQPAEPGKHESLRSGEHDVILGLRMKVVFDLAKEFTDMPLDQVELLLESDVHEARVGAVSVMDFQARRKRTSPERRRELFDLYLRRHDRIDNWDLVDRAAPWVVGGYLADKPRDVLYELARSGYVWERRTAIAGTYFFIRQGDVGDTFAIAEILLHDEHDLIRKAVGSWLREAGKHDRERLIAFLDEHAATMPRTTLRYSIEHLDGDLRARYMAA
jgi:3-methyladenine DNA glycosylase AlkD